SMLAERLHEHAYRYLQGIPQYAYMKGRSAEGACFHWILAKHMTMCRGKT
ncbi:Pol, partial [Symbiodinium microadriaticum]